MAKIPTTEHCEQCANETPKEILAKSGRARVRVFQDLDDGTFTCERGHKVDLGPLAENSMPPAPTPDPPERKPAAAQPVRETAVAVEEEPQSYQAQVIPGSSRLRQGGALEVTLLVPEQYVGPLTEYCAGIGKTVEEHINEVVSSGFENGWFV
jgi:hypothetical protein